MRPRNTQLILTGTIMILQAYEARAVEYRP